MPKMSHMQETQEYWFRTVFRLRMYDTFGDGFQQFFSKLMHCYDGRFQSIAPWGNWGDGGNDGWIPQDGHYHQVYGPKPLTDPNDSAATALKKAVDDFYKLPVKWADVKRYTFVMNDRFYGIPAPIDSALQKLAAEQHLIYAQSLSSSQLLERFMTLSRDQRHDIIGFVPDGDPAVLDPSAMSELLFELTKKSVGHLNFLSEDAPEFDTKLQFNGLTHPVSDRIRGNSYRTQLVDAFLQQNDSGTRQAISQEIKAYYEESKMIVPDGSEGAANARYGWLVLKLMPPKAGDHPHTATAYRDAAEVVIAKYFETCDVYEHPDSPASA